jgi:hydroxymethylpyrimidine/phosphomethylpyrimidine kinase
MSETKIPRLLAIAGSDSSGGAGIQADIKTATALGAYAMTAITAVTAQDTTGVHAVQLMPPDLVIAQIRACLDDIGADAIKIGMLGSAEIAAAVVETLRAHAASVPIVLDPVLTSTSGTPLLDDAGLKILREYLTPLSTLVTPNIPEAELLTEIRCADDAGIRRAGDALLAMGAKAVLIKGGHGRGENLVDTLITREGREAFAFPRIDTQHTHGTGCTYATAIAVGLAEGRGLEDAITRAVHYLRSAIETAPGLGRGHGPLNHMHGKDV